MTPRYTLRDLPLAAKLVASLFLLAVGLGYFSALVQLHLQHSTRNGEPLPSDVDVVAIFAGVERYNPAETPAPICKLEKLVMGPRKDSPWNGSGSMAPAFFERDSDNGPDGRYKSLIKESPVESVDVDRDGERHAVQAWIALPNEKRKAAYTADLFAKPASVKAITKGYEAEGGLKIKSILTDRCARCHGKDGEVANYPLETYEQFAKYLEVPKLDQPAAGSWVPSQRFVSIEKLTQSTHAHLLSFAMLFGLTGFLFAFTSYPALLRFLVAPSVLLAQVCDVS